MLLSFGQGSLRRAVLRRPGQQLLPDAAAAADLSAGVTPRSGAVTFPHRLPLRSIPCSASASNKPHPAAKSTPVWLAIWHIWAGFANSQLRCAAFRCIYLYTCAHPHCCHLGLLLRQSKSFGPSAPIAYATSVSPPDEAVAWPWCRYSMGDEAVTWPGRRCLVLDMAATWPGTSFLQITARANPCSRHLWGTLARAVASI